MGTGTLARGVCARVETMMEINVPAVTGSGSADLARVKNAGSVCAAAVTARVAMETIVPAVTVTASASADFARVKHASSEQRIMHGIVATNVAAANYSSKHEHGRAEDATASQ